MRNSEPPDKHTPLDENDKESFGVSPFATVMMLLVITLITYFSFWNGSQWFYGQGIYAP